jgi:hypothetical protein
MAVLARVHITSQQRVDLPQLLGIESYTAFDFRALIQAFVGSTRPYIARGFEITGKTGLFVAVSVADCFVFNPLDDNGSFYLGTADAQDLLIELPPSQPFVYLEARFKNETSAAVSASYWDPLAVTGSAEGSEFTATQNSQNAVVLELSFNTVGFSTDAIPIVVCATSNSAVTTLSDARPLLFRLGLGGSSPNPGYKFPWSVNRGEPLTVGVSTGDNLGSSFRSRDNTGILNDKGIRTFKEMFDAICSRVAEISGASIWYSNSSIEQYVGGLSLSSLFFDSVGHALQPNRNFVYHWTGTHLTNTGTETGSWKANYCDIEWLLGKSFTSGTDRSYSDVQFNVEIPDGHNAYLLLERELVKNAGNNLDWKLPTPSTTYTDFVTNYDKVVSGVTGDFGGIAVGDYIRKESQGYSQYYRVVALATATSLFSQTLGVVADSSVVAVKLESVIDQQSSEPLRYFRSRYSESDIVVLPASVEAPHADYYWLARRRGDFISLRDYGPLFKDKNWEHIDRAWSKVKLLKEYQNLFLGGGGVVTFELVPGDNTIQWSAPFTLEIGGRSAVYSVPASSAVLSDGDCIYVDIPEEDVSQNLTPIVCPLSSVPLDPAAIGHTGRSYVMFFRSGNSVLGMGEAPDLDSGESGNVGWDLPLNIRTRLGIVSEISYQAYNSYTQIDINDDYATAIGKLDNSTYELWNQENQDRTLKLVRGGYWSWDSVTGNLVNDSDAFIQIPDLLESRNRIAAQTITLPNDGDIAYVELNRSGATPAALTVVVISAADMETVSPTGNHRLVIARRIGGDCLVGTCLFTNTEAKLLDHDMSLVDSYDPSNTATNAPQGTQFINTAEPQVYVKQDAGLSKNWKPLDWSKLVNTYSGHASVTGIGLFFSGANNEEVNVSGVRTFYVQGQPFHKTATEQKVMSGTPGIRYFYYDNAGILQQSTTKPSWIVSSHVASAYWTGTEGHSLRWDFHGLVSAEDSHWKRNLFGLQYVSGFDISASPLEIGVLPSSDTSSFVYLEEGELLDNDIKVLPVSTTSPSEKWEQDLGSGLAITNAAVLPVLFVDNSGVTQYIAPDANKFPFYHAGGNTFPYYDNAGTLTEASNGDYLVYWVYGSSNTVVDDTNFIKVGASVFVRPHNEKFSLLESALSSDIELLSDLNIGKTKALYRIIIHCDSLYVNATHRCKIVQIDDWRRVASDTSHLFLRELNGGKYSDGNHGSLVVRKISQSSNPSTAEDVLSYKELSLWLNQNTRDVWILKNNNIGAADWRQLILDGGNNSALTIGSKVAQNVGFIYNSLSRITLNANGVDIDQTLRVNNNLASVVTSVTTATANVDTYFTEVAISLSSDCTLRLPAAGGANSGKEYSIKKLNSDSFSVTILPDGTDTIEGRTSVKFSANGEVCKLKSAGTTWRIL